MGFRGFLVDFSSPGSFRCNVAGFDQNWVGFRGFLVDFGECLGDFSWLGKFLLGSTGNFVCSV